MCPGNNPSADLVDYHRSVAAGGIGMTTVAYASVHRTGLSFPHQLWLRKEAIPGLRKLTDSVHAEGAAASIQIGHCGLMAKRSIAGGRPLSPSGKFNLYGPTFPVRINESQIREIIQSFGEAVHLARESGFDAVEVHAGHGYLISQFLSPLVNKRKDRWGGSFENRARFMNAVMDEVKKAARMDIAVLVKMNLRDGVNGGMELDESLKVAASLENHGADALVLSGGLVNRSPMYIMRGRMPVKIMGYFLKNPFMRFGVSYFGELLIKPQPFVDAYFLEDALKVREKVKLPLVYVGGLTGVESVGKVLSSGFEFVSFARALINDPAFINKLRSRELKKSECNHSNYCIAVMYTGQMACYQNQTGLPQKWLKKLREQ
jgi:2,4-dienoyl-CoA reductase-like NADH-dependent reductase (Old Yellow Enzyme family)